MSGILFILCCYALASYLDDKAREFERIETRWLLRVQLEVCDSENRALRSALQDNHYRALPRSDTWDDATIKDTT